MDGNPTRKRLRVLVVDDSPDMVDSTAQLLRLWSHEARVAPSGPAALTIAPEFQPHVVLLDIGMAGMDGWEVIRRLKDMPGLEQTLFVAITGFCQPSDRRKSAEAGFDCHFIKPVDPESLRRLLDHQASSLSDTARLAAS